MSQAQGNPQRDTCHCAYPLPQRLTLHGAEAQPPADWCPRCGTPFFLRVPRITRAEAARLGGLVMAQRPGHMRAIGRLGGLSVSRDRAHMAAIGRRGGLRHGAGESTE